MRLPLCTRVAATAILLASLLPSTARAIIEGSVDPNTMDSPWAGVGSITIGTGTYSGALIAPNYVLTAAHVVSGRAPGDITFTLNFGGDLTHRITADAVFVQPGYTGGVGIQGSGTKDLALIRLAQPAPAGVPIYELHTDHLPQSAIITMVGYGAGGSGLAGPTIDPRPDVKRVGANVAECFAFTPGIESCGIAALTGSGPRAVYFFDFDAPAAPGQPDGGRLPNEVSFAGGDSGSPAFVNVHGQWRVAGVNTFSGRLGESGPIGVYGSVGGGVLLSDDNGAWVRGVMSQPTAGSTVQPPVPEPRTWFLLCLGLPLLAWATMRGRVSAHRR